MSMTIQLALDLIPVVLALISVFVCAQAVRHVRRTADRAVMALACCCSMLLILAQSSWWAAKIMGQIEDTAFSNWIWLAFNSGVMMAFILFAWPRSRNARG